jgi:hypothetical protein
MAGGFVKVGWIRKKVIRDQVIRDQERGEKGQFKAFLGHF